MALDMWLLAQKSVDEFPAFHVVDWFRFQGLELSVAIADRIYHFSLSYTQRKGIKHVLALYSKVKKANPQARFLFFLDDFGVLRTACFPDRKEFEAWKERMLKHISDSRSLSRIGG